MLKIITVRIPGEILDRLPPPSLTGERAQFIRDAIAEKLERDAQKEKRSA